MAAIADHYGISSRTVHQIITGQRHADIRPASNAPTIIERRVPAEEIRREGGILKARGVPIPDIARQLGISRATAYRHLGQGRGAAHSASSAPKGMR